MSSSSGTSTAKKAIFRDLEPGQYFLHNETRFMKLSSHLFFEEGNRRGPVNAFQQGGGKGVLTATFIAEDAEVILLNN